MRVLKFGGSSVAGSRRLAAVAEIVAAAAGEEQILVVSSAMAGVTDRLVQMMHEARNGENSWQEEVQEIEEQHLGANRELGGRGGAAVVMIEQRLEQLRRLLTGVSMIGECPPAVADRILATGERLAVPIFATALEAAGFWAEVVDGTEVLVAGSGGEVDLEATRGRLEHRLGRVPHGAVTVVTGFVTASHAGGTTTLGRGGSDLSATALAAACDASRVEIWTDVSGVLSAPPRLMAGARTLPRLSFAEAAELAFFGAEVLHPRCLEPVAGKGIPVLIRNSLRPSAAGTVVEEQAVEVGGARAVAAVAEVKVLQLSSSTALGYQSGPGVGLDGPTGAVLAMSGASAGGGATVVVRREHAEEVASGLRAKGCVVTAQQSTEAALVAVVGSALLSQPWTVGRALEALGRRGVGLGGLFVGAAGAAVALLVDRGQLQATLETIHDALMLGRRAEVEEVKNERATNPGGGTGRHRHGRPEARASLA